jgi:hypothetical protein
MWHTPIVEPPQPPSRDIIRDIANANEDPSASIFWQCNSELQGHLLELASQMTRVPHLTPDELIKKWRDPNGTHPNDHIWNHCSLYVMVATWGEMQWAIQTAPKWPAKRSLRVSSGPFFLTHDPAPGRSYVWWDELAPDKSPLTGSGRMPYQEAGLVRQRSTDVPHYICCGKPYTHPGCWINTESPGQMIRFEPFEPFASTIWGLLDARDYNAIEREWKKTQTAPQVTAWVSPDWFARVIAATKTLKDRIAPQVRAAFEEEHRAFLDDPFHIYTLPIIDGFAKILHQQSIYNTIFGDAPVGIDDLPRILRYELASNLNQEERIVVPPDAPMEEIEEVWQKFVVEQDASLDDIANKWHKSGIEKYKLREDVLGPFAKYEQNKAAIKLVTDDNLNYPPLQILYKGFPLHNIDHDFREALFQFFEAVNGRVDDRMDEKYQQLMHLVRERVTSTINRLQQQLLRRNILKDAVESGLEAYSWDEPPYLTQLLGPNLGILEGAAARYTTAKDDYIVKRGIYGRGHDMIEKLTRENAIVIQDGPRVENARNILHDALQSMQNTFTQKWLEDGIDAEDIAKLHAFAQAQNDAQYGAVIKTYNEAKEEYDRVVALGVGNLGNQFEMTLDAFYKKIAILTVKRLFGVWNNEPYDHDSFQGLFDKFKQNTKASEELKARNMAAGQTGILDDATIDRFTLLERIDIRNMEKRDVGVYEHDLQIWERVIPKQVAEERAQIAAYVAERETARQEIRIQAQLKDASLANVGIPDFDALETTHGFTLALPNMLKTYISNEWKYNFKSKWDGILPIDNVEEAAEQVKVLVKTYQATRTAHPKYPVNTGLASFADVEQWIAMAGQDPQIAFQKAWDEASKKVGKTHDGKRLTDDELNAIEDKELRAKIGAMEKVKKEDIDAIIKRIEDDGFTKVAKESRKALKSFILERNETRQSVRIYCQMPPAVRKTDFISTSDMALLPIRYNNENFDEIPGVSFGEGVKIEPDQKMLFSDRIVKWEQNSCWLDATLIAMFKIPETPLENLIRTARTIFGYKRTIQMGNKSLKHLDGADAKDVLDMANTLLWDIEYLQGKDVADANRVCIMRTHFEKIAKYPVKLGDFSSTESTITSIAALFGADNHIQEKIGDNEPEKAFPKPALIIQVVTGFDEDQIREPIPGYTIMSMIYHGGQHFTTFVYDPKWHSWTFFNTRPEGVTIQSGLFENDLPPLKWVGGVVDQVEYSPCMCLYIPIEAQQELLKKANPPKPIEEDDIPDGLYYTKKLLSLIPSNTMVKTLDKTNFTSPIADETMLLITQVRNYIRATWVANGKDPAAMDYLQKANLYADYPVEQINDTDETESEENLGIFRIGQSWTSLIRHVIYLIIGLRVVSPPQPMTDEQHITIQSTLKYLLKRPGLYPHAHVFDQRAIITHNNARQLLQIVQAKLFMAVKMDPGVNFAIIADQLRQLEAPDLEFLEAELYAPIQAALAKAPASLKMIGNHLDAMPRDPVKLSHLADLLHRVENQLEITDEMTDRCFDE